MQSARTLHAFLVASTLIVIAGALVVTRTTGTLGTGFGLLDGIAVMMGLSALAISSLVRQRLPGRPTGPGEDDWWRENLGRALVVWGLLELTGAVGAVTLIVTRQLPGYGLLGVLSIGLLLQTRPARLGAARY
jgi:hypothetical protein